ncbi:MAG: hypothetical protein SNG35_04255, partial [Rikenellaceae bacterium]
MKSLKLLSLLLLVALSAITLEAQINNDLFRNTPVGGVVTSGKLPDFTAYTDSGEMVKLQELCQGRYTVLITGCLTCPEFRRINPTVEAIYADYAPKGVQFFFVYKTLRHPELDGYVEAQSISERLMMVERMKGILKGNIPWLIDDMDNNISSTLRSGSRSVYIISPKGEIINGWSAPQDQPMRQALTSAVGAPKRVTSPEELNLPPMERALRRNNTESETTIERPDGLVIVKSTPTNSEDIYYVKMRAEADAQLLESGTGRLALGFFPDPLYDAHWNNLAEPMKYTLKLPDGVKATPQEASANRGRGDSDNGPRQFWVDIKGASPLDKIEVTYHYYGCTPYMCEAFTHSYTIELTPEG